MKVQRSENKFRPFPVSRDAGIVVGVSVMLSMIALVTFVAILPA